MHSWHRSLLTLKISNTKRKSPLFTTYIHTDGCLYEFKPTLIYSFMHVNMSQLFIGLWPSDLMSLTEIRWFDLKLISKIQSLPSEPVCSYQETPALKAVSSSSSYILHNYNDISLCIYECSFLIFHLLSNCYYWRGTYSYIHTYIRTHLHIFFMARIASSLCKLFAWLKEIDWNSIYH